MSAILLPLDCEVRLWRNFLEPWAARQLFKKLKSSIHLAPQALPLPDGKVHWMDTPKTVFTDQELIRSSLDKEVPGSGLQTWIPELLPVKQRLEDLTGRLFQVGVVLYYAHGALGVDYHSDLRAFGDTSCIPSLSLGVSRRFSLRAKNNPAEELTLDLSGGDLLIMGMDCQEKYEHALLPDPSEKQDRINVTFRTYGDQKPL